MTKFSHSFPKTSLFSLKLTSQKECSACQPSISPYLILNCRFSLFSMITISLTLRFSLIEFLIFIGNSRYLNDRLVQEPALTIA